MVGKSNSKTAGKSPETREDRLKSALKANLAKRKAQSRVRAQDPQDEDPLPGATQLDKDA